MPVERKNVLVPAWPSDEQESPNISEINPAPYFDQELNAWILSRHGDIVAVLRHKHAVPASVKRGEAIPHSDEALRIRLRTEALTTLSPALLRQWKHSMQPELDTLLHELPACTPVDLLAAYARPVCLVLAAIATGISPEKAETLCEHARQVSLSTADPNDDSLRVPSQASQEELQRDHFHAKCLALRDSTFVAISQTVPCLLGNAWYALMRQPAQWRMLHQNPALIEQAVEELLRCAGLTRLIARQAMADLRIDGITVRKGQRILLRIIAGNRDPQQFPDPRKVDLARSAAGHLTLGVGRHSCVGANLIRMALVTITRPLLRRFSSATLTQPVDWHGGAIFQFPRSLWVRLIQ